MNDYKLMILLLRKNDRILSSYVHEDYEANERARRRKTFNRNETYSSFNVS